MQAYKNTGAALAVAAAVWIGPTTQAQAQSEGRAVAGLHIASAHDAPGFESRNWGLYHRWASGVTVGAFHNSYGRNSAYGGWLWEIDAAGRFGVFLGAATGYGDTAEGIELAPILAPTVRWSPEGSRWGLRLSWFADPRENAAQVLHLSLEYRY